uniref:RNA-directed DNA methylation 4 n=1 Tax=Rhabditophanes sp. KR3021 TaxID=114890 RepID=A0AC35TM18_9BILA
MNHGIEDLVLEALRQHMEFFHDENSDSEGYESGDDSEEEDDGNSVFGNNGILEQIEHYRNLILERGHFEDDDSGLDEDEQDEIYSDSAFDLNSNIDEDDNMSVDLGFPQYDMDSEEEFMEQINFEFELGEDFLFYDSETDPDSDDRLIVVSTDHHQGNDEDSEIEWDSNSSNLSGFSIELIKNGPDQTK